MSGGSAFGNRLYGNATFSYEHIRQHDGETLKDDLTREIAIINYEDILFYKNQLRLTANLQRRELSFSDYHEFRPIYYLDLKSYGYAVNVRYSPYTRKSLTASGIDLVDVFYRDWRVTTQLVYPDYPTFNLVYSRLKSFDKEEVHITDSHNRNLVLESSYSIDPVSLRANYSNLKQVNNLGGGNELSTNTYSATAGINQNLRNLGYFSSTYNYYDTKRESGDLLGQESHTHSINSLFIFNAINHFTFNTNYSGRFQRAEQLTFRTENDNHNFSAQAELSPTGYLSFQAGKGYQETSRSDGNNSIVEYMNLGAVATRYLRNGVDTRLTYNRTIFQQSPRLASIIDTTGAVIATVNKGEYILDTYQASMNFYLRKYIRTYLDMSLSHDSDPVDVQRRYQLTRSADMRVNFTRRLEGRLRATSTYTGDKLVLDRSFSENYNAGITYTPRGNLNINLTYIYTDFNSTVRTSLSSVTGYISYSFRRAFTAYLSVNQQKQTRQTPVAQTDEFIETEAQPRTINGQILMYLSRKATLSVAYNRNRSEDALGEEITNQSIQSVLSIQI